MTDDDTMDVLTGFAVLLALALFDAAWLHTFTEWESTCEPLSHHSRSRLRPFARGLTRTEAHIRSPIKIRSHINEKMKPSP
jgi:hypothetical protein